MSGKFPEALENSEAALSMTERTSAPDSQEVLEQVERTAWVHLAASNFP